MNVGRLRDPGPQFPRPEGGVRLVSSEAPRPGRGCAFLDHCRLRHRV